MKPAEFTIVDPDTSQSNPLFIIPVAGMLWFPWRSNDRKGLTMIAVPGQQQRIVREDCDTVTRKVVDALRGQS